MKSLVSRIAAIALVALAAVVPASAQSRGGRGIELFSEPNFGGDSRFFPDGQWNLAERGFNDRTMSVRVYGRDSWQLCDNHGYGGACVFINRDEPDLNRLGIAGRVSSFRRADDGYHRDGGGYGRPDTRGAGLILFEGPNFSGRSVRLHEQVADFEWNRFNDTAQSLVANGRWVVCEHRDFGGACQVVIGEYNDLNRIGMWGRISSARPANANEGGGYDDGGYGYPGGHYGDTRPTARGRTAAFFVSPDLRGISCSNSRGCFNQAADQFCRQAGYREAEYYSIGYRGRSEVLEDLLCVR
jgi:hypothetical protein